MRQVTMKSFGGCRIISLNSFDVDLMLMKLSGTTNRMMMIRRV